MNTEGFSQETAFVWTQKRIINWELMLGGTFQENSQQLDPISHVH
jgi:hypothetical protein